MKKIIFFLVIFFVCTPAFGFQTLSDKELEAVYCRSGVSIMVDDVQISLFIEKIAYVDSDGYNSDYFGAGKTVTQTSPGADKIDHSYSEVGGKLYELTLVNGAVDSVREIKPVK